MHVDSYVYIAIFLTATNIDNIWIVGSYHIAQKFDGGKDWRIWWTGQWFIKFSLLTFLSKRFSYETYNQFDKVLFIKVLYMLHSSKFFLVKFCTVWYDTENISSIYVAIRQLTFTTMLISVTNDKSWKL